MQGLAAGITLPGLNYSAVSAATPHAAYYALKFLPNQTCKDFTCHVETAAEGISMRDAA